MTVAVAPHTGAWIETAHARTYSKYDYVAPHTGAWIETLINLFVGLGKESHPTRVRGLKHQTRSSHAAHLVAPHTGAWIETTNE